MASLNSILGRPGSVTSHPDSLLAVLELLSARSTPIVTAPDDKVVLASTTGSLHSASRQLLVTHSSFFANLFAIPPPLDATGQPDPISLPSATPASLALILAVLTILGPTLKSDPTQKLLRSALEAYQPCFTAKDLAGIGEALHFAHVYDISSFGREFVWPILVRLPNLTPVIGFVLTAIISPRTPSRQLPYVKRLFPTGATEVPAELAAILRLHAPEHIGRYQAYYASRTRARNNLRVALRSGQALTDGGGNQFSLRCQGQHRTQEPGFRNRYGNPAGRPGCCKAFKSKRGSLGWKDLREKAAEDVYAKVVGDTREWRHSEIVKVIERTVPCQKCARRLAPTFILAIERYLEVVNGY